MARALFLCLLSAVLLILSFPTFNIELLAWVGFVPLFFALRGKSGFKAFLLSYITGLVFWSGVIYWLVHVTLIGLILLVMYLALYFAIFGWAVSYISHKPVAINYLIIPSLWVLLEYLRSRLLTGFGWAALGYSQYMNLPLIQIADVTGVWGVSFLVIAVNVLVYEAARYLLCPARRQEKPSLPFVYCLLTALAVILSLGYGHYRLRQPPAAGSGKPVRISLVQGNIPQELKWQPQSQGFILDKYITLSRQALLDGPDLTIWPEAASPGLLFRQTDAWIFQGIFELAKGSKANLLIGSAVEDNGDYFNSALLINPAGSIARRYDKLRLVPFGEYIPLRKTLSFLETVVPIGDFSVGKEYTLFEIPGTSPDRERLPGYFAVLICFEDVFPELSRRFVEKGAGFLVNITNDAWFKRTAAPYQHLSASVFRAVENRRYLVRAANTGVSGFISPHGRVRPLISAEGEKTIFVEGVKTGVVYAAGSRSFYTRYGDLFVLLCLFTFICGIITQILKPQRSSAL